MDVLDVLWRHSVVVITAAQFIQQSQNSGSAEVQVLHAACPRFAMVRISGNGPGWIKSKRLSSVTILQKTIHHGNSFFVTTYILVMDLSTNVN